MSPMELQDTLKGLPDGQLVQYMKQPNGQVPQYLVLAELNRRKKLREGGANAGARPPESTVAQDVERSAGVAQLPTNPQMFQQPQQGFAGGGIVAFADGGDINSPYIGYRPGRYRRDKAPPDPFNWIPEYETGPTNEEEIAYLQSLQASPPAPAPTQSPVPQLADDQRAMPMAPSAVQPAPPAAAPVGLAALPQSAVMNVPRGQAPGNRTLPDPGQLDLSGINADMSPEEAQAAAAAALAQRKDIIGEDETEAYLKEIRADREGIKSKKADNVNNALMTAGFAMMSGDSPYALKNIGAGAQEGLRSFVQAKKADQAADNALREAEMAAVDRRAARKVGDADAVARATEAEKARKVQAATFKQQAKVHEFNAKEKGVDRRKAEIMLEQADRELGQRDTQLGIQAQEAGTRANMLGLQRQATVDSKAEAINQRNADLIRKTIDDSQSAVEKDMMSATLPPDQKQFMVMARAVQQIDANPFISADAKAQMKNSLRQMKAAMAGGQAKPAGPISWSSLN